jgi:hypothetical protein
LLFNPESNPTAFTLGGQWQLLLDSSAELSPGLSASSCLLVPAHAALVLRRSTM